MNEGDTFMWLPKFLGRMPLHAPQGFSLYGQKDLPFGAESHSTVVNSNTGLFLLKTLYVSELLPNPNKKFGVGVYTEQSVQTINY